MITLEEYWMGRDRQYRSDLTHELVQNAIFLLGKVNALLERMAEEGIAPDVDPLSGTPVSSGWRPQGVNDRTQNAAANSKHVQALAVDLRDTPQRSLARWCLRHIDALEDCGLWMEDPRWTPRWVHLQALPPGSGRRVFVPSSAPALVAALKEQGGSA